MTAPTGRHKVLYYTLGLTPPVARADWVRRDIATTGWQIRRGLQFAAGMLLGALIAGAVLEFSAGLLWGAVTGAVIGALIQMTFMTGYVRRRTLSYYDKRWAKQRG